MKAYVISRYRSEDKEQFKKQLDITKQISKMLVQYGHDVFVPHLMYPQFLDDNIPEERNKGIDSAIRWMKSCDCAFAYIGLGISDGMECEINEARYLEKTIFYFSNLSELEDILKREMK